MIRAWRKTPRELWTKEKICPLCCGYVFNKTFTIDRPEIPRGLLLVCDGGGGQSQTQDI